LYTYIFIPVYAVVCIAVIPIGFAVFKTQYQMLDVVLAAIVGAALSLIPTLGGVASLAGTVGILYWRMSRDLLFPDILVSVLGARLAMLPVLLLLTHR
jgi:hypothetical protein